MSPQMRLRMVPLPAEPLDEASRRLVPRANPDIDERTGKDRDADLPSTEPDGASTEQLARIRDSVLSGLRLVEDARQKTPLDARVPEGVESLLAEKDTRPVPRADPSSDVFAPAGSRDRVLDSEAATPRDRPANLVGQDRVHAVDLHKAPTLTMKGRPYAPRSEPTEPLPRHERESVQERAMVESIYNSERAFHDIRNTNPARAADIVSLVEALKATGNLTDRDMVLAAHAREKVALKRTTASLYEGQEDRVIAFALVGRELDDRYRDHMKIEQERLVGEIDALATDKRDEVFADFESFIERDAANDSNFCRREMHKALREEREELHRAYVFALALDRRKPRVDDENARTVRVDDDDALGKRGRG